MVTENSPNANSFDSDNSPTHAPQSMPRLLLLPAASSSQPSSSTTTPSPSSSSLLISPCCIPLQFSLKPLSCSANGLVSGDILMFRLAQPCVRILDLNAAMERATGFHRAALIGRRLDDTPLHPWAAFVPSPQYIAKFVQTSKPSPFASSDMLERAHAHNSDHSSSSSNSSSTSSSSTRADEDDAEAADDQIVFRTFEEVARLDPNSPSIFQFHHRHPQPGTTSPSPSSSSTSSSCTASISSCSSSSSSSSSSSYVEEEFSGFSQRYPIPFAATHVLPASKLCVLQPPPCLAHFGARDAAIFSQMQLALNKQFESLFSQTHTDMPFLMRMHTAYGPTLEMVIHFCKHVSEPYTFSETVAYAFPDECRYIDSRIRCRGINSSLKRMTDAMKVDKERKWAQMRKGPGC